METSPIPESPKEDSSRQQQSHKIVTNSPVPNSDETMMNTPDITPWHTGLPPMEGGLHVGLDALSTVAANFSNTFHTPVDSRNTMSPSVASLSSANNLNFILNPSGSSASPSGDPGLTPQTHRRSSSILSQVTCRNSTEVVSEHETAFLLRQFAENTGEWYVRSNIFPVEEATTELGT